LTVVAGLVDAASNNVILIADSRVTYRDDTTIVARKDICQKTASLDNQGVFGFAADDINSAACIAHYLTGTYKKRGVGWLKFKHEVDNFLRDLEVFKQKDLVQFLVAFMDDTDPVKHPAMGVVPRATLVKFSTAGDHVVTRFGLDMIGSGSAVYDAVKAGWIKILNFARQDDLYGGVGHRAMFFSEVLLIENKSRDITSVGGLMQVHFVEQDGVRAVPYQRWVEVDKDHGTYVLMDIDADGRWVQLHEPTGMRVPLRFPDEKDFGKVSTATHDNFVLESRLTKDSPGVKPKSNQVKLYELRTSASGDLIVRTPGRPKERSDKPPSVNE